jgi:transcriptional regulator with XRE-family HTH domain
MEMLVDTQLIRSEREKRAWSQSHLADVSGLGLRTIQRIEGVGHSSYESAAAIAAAFSLSVSDLRAELSSDGASESLRAARPWFIRKKVMLPLSVLSLIAAVGIFFLANRPAQKLCLYSGAAYSVGSRERPHRRVTDETGRSVRVDIPNAPVIECVRYEGRVRWEVAGA